MKMAVASLVYLPPDEHAEPFAPDARCRGSVRKAEAICRWPRRHCLTVPAVADCSGGQASPAGEAGARPDLPASQREGHKAGTEAAQPRS